MLASNVKVIQPKKLFNIEENAKRILRVAGYARVSTGRPEQKTSFESQQKHYKELVAKHSDWIDVGLYADEGITATSMRKRKQFLKMIQDAKDGKIDRIIVKSVSRFARNTVDCLATVEELTALGVDVFFELQNLSSLQDSKYRRHSYDLKRKDAEGNPKIEKVYTWVCINHKLNKKTACPQTQVKESSLEKAFIAALNTLIEDQDGFVKTVIENISEVLNTRLSEASLEGNKGRYEAKQKELQNVLANSLKTPTAENARLYEGLVQELESLKKKIETEELERSKTLMSKTRTLEFEQFITSSKLFHEFDEMVFRKLVEKVVICEDSVVFKFTDYLEREVPLID